MDRRCVAMPTPDFGPLRGAKRLKWRSGSRRILGGSTRDLLPVQLGSLPTPIDIPRMKSLSVSLTQGGY